MAAILFPVFARAREKARQTSCLSNLKQIGLGMLMYVQDYDETFPKRYWGSTSSYLWPNGKTTRGMWMAAIYPYVKNIQLFSCPSSTPKWYGQYIGNGFNYPMNGYLDGQRIGKVEFPAECVSNICGWYYWSNGANNYETSSGTPLGGPSVKKNHNEGTNAVMADGHAKWFGFARIWRGNSTWNGTEWGGDAANSKYWTLDGS